MVNHRRVRSRRLFLCTFIGCLILMMILFAFIWFFIFTFTLRVFFILDRISVLAGVALLSAVFYLSFRAVAVVALI